MLFASPNILLHRHIETAAVLFHVANFTIFPIFAVLIPIWLLFSPFWPLVIAYFVYLYYDWKTPSKGSRPSAWVRNWPLWKRFADYFPVKIVKTAEIPSCHNYIFGSHPHGILCHGIFCSTGTEGAGFAKLFPGITPSIATLNIQFMLPLRRELNMAVGGISASKESITYQLTRDKGGRAVVIVLGGAEEALDAHPHSFVLTLKHRMGFAKLALETGAHLVPIYSFGENDVYNQISNERGSWVREIQERIKHIIGFSPVLFNGRGIFNYSFGLLPYRKPINIVFGAPIPVKKVEKPTREQVQELHDQYCDALTKLFDNHKANYGISEDMKLTIL